MIEDMAGLNLVLLGKTGAGKSAAGNTILGRQAFKSEKSATSVTKDVVEESGIVYGFPVTVYDTPGLCDPKLEEHKIQQKYQSIFQKCHSELCAFFLVIKADRFTEEEKKTVEKIEKLLGEARLKQTWILFTRGDELEEEKKSIKQFINETEPLKKLIQKYDQRYHVFNNKKRGLEQVKSLLTNILKTCLRKMVKGATKRKETPVKIQKPKHTSSVPSPSSRRIVLLGKTGVGKSAAGNTILGQKKFKSQRKMVSVTSKCSEKNATVSGRSVSVVDTPGFFDTHMKPEQLMKEIAWSVYLSSPGPHAFIIVFPVTMRFSDHEQQISQMIEMMFGEEVLKYSMILFTHGDQLDGESVEELIEESPALKKLVGQCGGRFHVFNNRDENNRDQVNDLLQKIDTMIEQNGGGHYSNQMYEDAQRFRREEEEQRQKEEEQRKQQEKKLRQDEIERVRKETEKKTIEELKPQLRTEPGNKTPGDPSGFTNFFSKYRNCFYVAISIGVVIGAVTGVGFVVAGATTGIAAGVAAIAGGGVAGGAGIAGGGVAGVAAIAGGGVAGVAAIAGGGVAGVAAIAGGGVAGGAAGFLVGVTYGKVCEWAGASVSDQASGN